MPRRFIGLCLAFALIISVLLPVLSFQTYAQIASPVAVEPEPPTAVESTEPPVDPAAPAVEPAEDPGNTPQGISSTTPVFVLDTTVYLFFNQVTASGHSTATEGSIADAGPFLAGYRTDNARLFSLHTTASYVPNIRVCIYFGPNQFVAPGSVDLVHLDGGSWTIITASRDAGTVCGYTATLGIFVVAEPGSNPTPTATETSLPSATPIPTSTATTVPSHTPSPTSTATTTATMTSTLTNTPIPSTTPTSTQSASPQPTETMTTAPSPTISPTATATITTTPIPSFTPSATPSPTSPPTETATPSPAPTLPPTITPTVSPSHTSTPSPTSTPPASETPTSFPSLTATPTVATGKTQFALPNVWVIFSEPPGSGTTHGAVIDGSSLPALPAGYRADTAWFVFLSTTVPLTTNKQLCVLFPAGDFVDPAATVLLRQQTGSWTPLAGQVIDDLDSTQGTICGYTPVLGNFALAERLPSTSTPTASPSRTATPRPSATPSLTPSLSATATSTATVTSPPTVSITPSPSATSTITTSPTATHTHTAMATFTPIATASDTATATPVPSNTSSPTPTSTFTATATPSPSPTATPSPSSTLSPTSTATLAPGSYPTGTTLRATTRVNLRAAATTRSSVLGVIATGAIVTVTGPSVFDGTRFWVPVSTPNLGSGWMAGDYLVPVATPTPTTVSTPPTVAASPGAGHSTSTPTRVPGGFLAGDTVRTVTRLNLRSGPGTSYGVLTVLPDNATGQITGAGIPSGSNIFYPVRFDGHPAGFVAGAYLRLIAGPPATAPASSPTPTIAAPIRFTTVDLNLRSGPGTGYRVVTTLPTGTRVSLTGPPQRGGRYDWYPVIIFGIGSGWVAGAYLSVSGPI